MVPGRELLTVKLLADPKAQTALVWLAEIDDKQHLFILSPGEVRAPDPSGADLPDRRKRPAMVYAKVISVPGREIIPPKKPR